MRTYLVTGGAGFIGSNYIHYMFRKYGSSIRIINVDALTYAGNLENLKDIEDQDNYTFIKADITDADAIRKIFADKPCGQKHQGSGNLRKDKRAWHCCDVKLRQSGLGDAGRFVSGGQKVSACFYGRSIRIAGRRRRLFL